jgi:serine/threonine protein kinase
MKENENQSKSTESIRLKNTPLVLNHGKRKYKFTNWHVGTNYKLKKLIGEGSYGKVALAKEIKTGKCVAIKRIKHIFDDLLVTKRILRELAIQR